VMPSSLVGTLDSGGQAPKDEAMAKPLNPNLPVVVGAALAVLVLLGVLGGGVYLVVRELRQVYVYRSVEGRVLASELAARQVQSAKLRPASYTPEVSYEYLVDGKRYEGNRIHLYKENSTSEKAMARMRDRYPAGARVMVHYDPQDPSIAVLEAGFTVVSFAVFLGGLLGTLLAAFLGLKSRAGRRAAGP
jgi:Protein of unknown function (DUF3592)